MQFLVLNLVPRSVAVTGTIITCNIKKKTLSLIELDTVFPLYLFIGSDIILKNIKKLDECVSNQMED
jgi:hypothetical protein